jgi:hypothetical protein
MAWITPKTDWASNYAIGFSDFNRIEGNTVYLKGQTGYFDIDFEGFHTEDLRVRFHWHTEPETYPNFVHLSWPTAIGTSNAATFASAIDSLPPSLTPSENTHIPAVVKIDSGIVLGTIMFTSTGAVVVNYPFYTGNGASSKIPIGTGGFASANAKGLLCGAGMFPLITT